MAILNQDAIHTPTRRAHMAEVPVWANVHTKTYHTFDAPDLQNEFKSERLVREELTVRIECRDGIFEYSLGRAVGEAAPTTRELLEELNDRIIRQLALLALNEERGDGRGR